jgi:hypothetical protein
LIPLLSLSALVVIPWEAVALFDLGWLSRNLRSPSRRVMLTQNVDEQHRSHAFGFLHGLDVGGGVLAALGLLILLYHPQISIDDLGGRFKDLKVQRQQGIPFSFVATVGLR